MVGMRGSLGCLALVAAATLLVQGSGCGGGGGGPSGKGGATGAAGSAGGRGGGSAGSSGSGGSAGSAGSGGSGGAMAGTGGNGGSAGGSGGAMSCGDASADGGGGADGGTVDGGDAGNACTPPPDPFLTATPIVVGAASATPGTLPDPATSKRYYSFSGTKGEVIAIEATISSTLAFSSFYPDLVTTLHDASETQIARADDPFPRVSNVPTLYTVLPATGTYYVVVADCNAVFGAGAGCGAPSAILVRDFTIRVRDVAGATVINEGVEPGNDTAAGAATIAYTKAGGTAYVPLLLVGAFQRAIDTDSYAFTVPTDTPISSGARARASFWIVPSGKNGDGSIAAPEAVYVVDSSDTSGAHLAELDATQYGSGRPGTPTGPANLSVPVLLGHRYNLFVRHPNLAGGTSDFYFIWHAAGAIDEGGVESEPDDTINTNVSLDGTFNLDDGSYEYLLDGDLSPAGTDLDFIGLNINQPTILTGSCQARRRGSGIIGLSYQLLRKGDGSAIASQTESTTSDVGISASVPADGSVVLKISGTSQSATVTDKSYVCRFVTAP